MQPSVEMFMSPAPYTIGLDRPLRHAHEVMQMHRVRHLPVLEGGTLVGILSDRDLALVEALDGVDPADVLVEEAMSSAVYAVAPDVPLVRVVREMASRKYGSAVVLRDGHVVGIFTMVDACAVLADMMTERYGEGG